MVFAFVLQGRHVGPLRTSAGLVPPAGADLRLRVTDILTMVDGVIMVADD